MLKKLRVCILFGGRSGEHEVSIRSAQSVFKALDKNKYEVILQGLDKKGPWIPSDVTTHGKIDVYLPIMHGTYGEDGSIQGALELLDVAYVGSGVLGSAICMDKDISKRLLKQADIPTVRFKSIRNKMIADEELGKVIQELGLPLFVKPANLGSSVGIMKVKKVEDLRKAIDTAFLYDSKILIEECSNGREIECSVLGNEQPIASIPGEVIPAREFYDYEAKYIDEDGAMLEIPAKIDEILIQKIQAMAIKTFKVLECSGMARVDFFLKKDGTVLVNEANTIPGFTKISMYPKLWEASGLSYPKLLDKLIELALERKKEKNVLKRSYD